ncbi:MAG TPA: Clp protease N-terminal domain-containing protein [Spirillospora sp.]
MGVTKQAAQKRFVPKESVPELDPSAGFPRFTQRARNVVVASMNEARAAGNDHIVPAHIVLGLLSEPEGLAAKAIRAQDVLLDTVRQAATAVLPPESEGVPEMIPYDADAEKIMELTFREALRPGHNHVGTGHVLLAVLEFEDGDGVLSDLGIDKAKAEADITEALDAIAGKG